MPLRDAACRVRTGAFRMRWCVARRWRTLHAAGGRCTPLADAARCVRTGASVLAQQDAVARLTPRASRGRAARGSGFSAVHFALSDCDRDLPSGGLYAFSVRTIGNMDQDRLRLDSGEPCQRSRRTASLAMRERRRRPRWAAGEGCGGEEASPKPLGMARQCGSAEHAVRVGGALNPRQRSPQPPAAARGTWRH